MLDHRRGRVAAATFLLLTVCGSPLFGNIHLQLRPASQTTCSTGGTVDVTLYAVSDNASNQSIGAMSVLFTWDPTKLRLSGMLQNSTYDWFANFFPDDRGLMGINEDRGDGLFWSSQACTSNAQCAPFFGCNLGLACSNEGECRPADFCDFTQNCDGDGCCSISYCNPTGSPFNDGDAHYDAWAQVGGTPAFATPGNLAAGTGGLLVETLQFVVLGPGSSQVTLLASSGPFLRTVVYDGFTPSDEVTGTLAGPPASITVGSGAPPTAAAEGPRYIRVVPAAGAGTLALRVDGTGTGVTCVAKYVQANGTLATTPVFRTPAQWATVHVRGCQLIPGKAYNVRADCGTGLSSPVSITTYPWGDVNNAFGVDLDDILLVLDAFAGIFGLVTLQACDLSPCVPNGGIDLDDILSVLDAFAGIPYTSLCPAPCPATGACP